MMAGDHNKFSSARLQPARPCTDLRQSAFRIYKCYIIITNYNIVIQYYYSVEINKPNIDVKTAAKDVSIWGSTTSFLETSSRIVSFPQTIIEESMGLPKDCSNFKTSIFKLSRTFGTQNLVVKKNKIPGLFKTSLKIGTLQRTWRLLSTGSKTKNA